MITLSTLQPFQTDFCTAFPEGTAQSRKLWAECCVQHDLYLWAGGTQAERLAVDRQLKECVFSKGAPVPAWVMYLGVRLGSHSPVRYKEKEWGNAWRKFEGRPRYQALTANEVEQLIAYSAQQNPQVIPASMLHRFWNDLRARN